MKKSRKHLILSTRDPFFRDMIKRKSGKLELSKKFKNRKSRKKAKLELKKYIDLNLNHD